MLPQLDIKKRRAERRSVPQLVEPGRVASIVQALDEVSGTVRRKALPLPSNLPTFRSPSPKSRRLRWAGWKPDDEDVELQIKERTKPEERPRFEHRKHTDALFKRLEGLRHMVESWNTDKEKAIMSEVKNLDSIRLGLGLQTRQTDDVEAAKLDYLDRCLDCMLFETSGGKVEPCTKHPGFNHVKGANDCAAPLTAICQPNYGTISADKPLQRAAPAWRRTLFNDSISQVPRQSGSVRAHRPSSSACMPSQSRSLRVAPTRPAHFFDGRSVPFDDVGKTTAVQVDKQVTVLLESPSPSKIPLPVSNVRSSGKMNRHDTATGSPKKRSAHIPFKSMFLN